MEAFERFLSNGIHECFFIIDNGRFHKTHSVQIMLQKNGLKNPRKPKNREIVANETHTINGPHRNPRKPKNNGILTDGTLKVDRPYRSQEASSGSDASRAGSEGSNGRHHEEWIMSKSLFTVYTQIGSFPRGSNSSKLKTEELVDISAPRDSALQSHIATMLGHESRRR
ncbi:hypothetical protein RF11_06642 [Thelohanellus kitauei]|uniref:Uncharacterized protein n=1 Tax=Thelohanellus kitauei TaxID=669202 RepID=A0A0C2MK35_THEKT|nr:hypothetical protein RF11_06642 [Thelohanellus kitauei]